MMKKTRWVCKICGSEAERFANPQGTWISCPNEGCENYEHLKRVQDIDFLDYYVLPMEG